ncbi:hypothetical protein [Paenibacillus durus]|uniref:Uncharacterized protein n=2 Tax=Paenibacillus durus TaxID=44251 RepID=A0A0F7F9U2_PAEDU|nr:hypothetical protein [Paenibacillus durus]AKG35368.1 hypothetical protein VK70_12955 [Paenibacillus durus ATCC 35681]
MSEHEKEAILRHSALAYIFGQGTRDEREAMEEQLLGEDEALSAYLDILNRHGDELPTLDDTASFSRNIMNRLPPLSDQSEPDHEHGNRLQFCHSRWYNRTIIHYLVAASLTLLFLSSGVFDRLMTGELDVVVKNGDGSAFNSEQIIQKTTGWLERLMAAGRQ